ncbi:unnamed protein product [Closterium sp. NIES-64]|nr:unnamed protein product [Closterium sp. NIES-64]
MEGRCAARAGRRADRQGWHEAKGSVLSAEWRTSCRRAAHGLQGVARGWHARGGVTRGRQGRREGRQGRRTGRQGGRVTRRAGAARTGNAMGTQGRRATRQARAARTNDATGRQGGRETRRAGAARTGDATGRGRADGRRNGLGQPARATRWAVGAQGQRNATDSRGARCDGQ